MKNKTYLLVVILLLPFAVISQNEEGVVVENIVIQDSITNKPIDPLTPSRAAFYSILFEEAVQLFDEKHES